MGRFSSMSLRAALSDLEPRLSPIPNALSLATFENPLLILWRMWAGRRSLGNFWTSFSLGPLTKPKRAKAVTEFSAFVARSHLLGSTIHSLERHTPRRDNFAFACFGARIPLSRDCYRSVTEMPLTLPIR